MNFLLVLFLVTSSFAAEIDFHGYLRAGAGSNGKGAKQECFGNDGAPGNEFRLGNECSIYGEADFEVPFTKGGKEDPFFRSALRFAFFPAGNSSFEENDSDGNDLNIVEAFVEGGRIDGSPLTYWVGKRFYRDVDLYIYDWYYFAQMSGNGGGIGNIPLGSGKLAAAFLFETGATRTNVGRHQVQVIDLRWQDVVLGERDRLHIWGAFGQAPGGRIANNTPYEARNGWLLGARWHRGVTDGFNHLTVVYGRNLLESISLYGNSAFNDTVTNTSTKAERWRFVEHLAFQPLPKLGLFFGAALELWNPRLPGIDARGSWWSVGARPVYFFTNHYQLAFEAGHSVVHERAERNAAGLLNGPRSMTRFTIAPQLSVGPGLWTRPLLRAFYSRTFWNRAGQIKMASRAPSFAGSLDGHSIGLQAELWF